jgi:D-hexose-6-phosphate mutarotase
VVTVGPELRVELVVQNPGSSAFSYTGALHSYFSISDVANVTITGLEDGDYLDKVEQFRRKTQQGPITIEAETDRIYLETEADCVIQDKGWARSIQMAKIGSRTTVIWNPWQARARQLPDLADQEYRDMVCVETVNTVDDIVTVPPGGEGRLSAVISVR